MNLANSRKVEIFPAQVEPETAGRRRVGGTAGYVGIAVGELNIVESGLTPGDAQIGVERLDRFPIGRGMGRVYVSLRLGMRPRPGELERDVAVPVTG